MIMKLGQYLKRWMDGFSSKARPLDLSGCYKAPFPNPVYATKEIEVDPAVEQCALFNDLLINHGHNPLDMVHK